MNGKYYYMSTTFPFKIQTLKSEDSKASLIEQHKFEYERCKLLLTHYHQQKGNFVYEINMTKNKMKEIKTELEEKYPEALI